MNLAAVSPGIAFASGVLVVAFGLSFVMLLSAYFGRQTSLRAWALAFGIGAAVLGLLTAAGWRLTTPVTWAIRDSGLQVWGLFVGLGLAVATGLRWGAKVDWVRSFLLAEAIVFIGLASWVPRSGTPSWRSPDFAEPVECFTTPWRWTTYGRSGLVFDVAPNIALYVPLGIALAAVLRNRWIAVLGALLVTLSTEAYQGLVTDRECAGNDVLANWVGGVVGVIVVLVIEALVRRRDPGARSA